MPRSTPTTATSTQPLAVLVLESGAAATVSGLRRNGAGQDARLEVFGTLNSFGAGIDDHTPMTSTEPGMSPPGPPYDQFIDRFERAFRAEADAFVRLASGNGRQPQPAARRTRGHPNRPGGRRVDPHRLHHRPRLTGRKEPDE